MKIKSSMKKSSRPKPLGPRPLPRRGDAEDEKRNGDPEERKAGQLKIKRIDGSVQELNGHVAPEDVMVTSTVIESGMKKTLASSRPKPLPRRGDAEDEKRNGDPEERKAGQTLIKRMDGSVQELNGHVAPEDVVVPSTGKQTSLSKSNSTTSKFCRSYGVYHCHTCPKSMPGKESYEQHMKSNKHLKKARDQRLLELAAKERNKMALAAKEPNWKKWTETGCSYPGCTHHCTVCDCHLTDLMSTVEEHFESSEHASKLFALSKEPVAMTTKVTDLLTGKRVFLDDPEQMNGRSSKKVRKLHSK